MTSIDFDLESHPIRLIADLRDRDLGLTLSFSQYLYRPQSPFDERNVFQVPISHVTPEWLFQQLAELPPEWDLALNSLVLDSRRRTRHVPMIDFINSSLSGRDWMLMRAILEPALWRSLVFFNSGRSLHAYALHLLDPGEWRELMGRLLLLNLPNEEAVVDSRWVGHRLISGYSALRWSSNSQHYLHVPERIDLAFVQNQ